MFRTTILAVGLFALWAGPASAQITNFILTGAGGTGLLGSNQVPAVTGGGTGGLLGTGISFNATTNVLTINTGWGSGSGFTNLTGNATMGHLHGPTLSPAPTSFGENANVKYPLDSLTGWNPSATNGGFNGTVSILPADTAALFAGQFYMNVHTTLNSGGEIRAQLVPVPEPGLMLAVAAGGLFVGRLRRQFRK